VPRLKLEIDEKSYFERPFERTTLDDIPVGFVERVEELVDLIIGIYRVGEYRPAVVCGLGPFVEKILDDSSFSNPITKESLAESQIEWIPWLLVLSSPFVETYGRTRLLEAPGWHVEVLGDGSVLYVAFKDILYMTDAAMHELYEYLDIENPFNKEVRD
jgi:hypothetical protein